MATDLKKIEAALKVFQEARDAKGVEYAIRLLAQRLYSFREVKAILVYEGYEPIIVKQFLFWGDYNFLLNNEEAREKFMKLVELTALFAHSKVEELNEMLDLAELMKTATIDLRNCEGRQNMIVRRVKIKN